MKRAWTRGENGCGRRRCCLALWRLGRSLGQIAARRTMGWPQVLSTSPTNRLQSIALSSDGSVLAASGQTDPISVTSGTMYLWDARTLQPQSHNDETWPKWAIKRFCDSRSGFLTGWQTFRGARHSLGYSLYHLPSSRLMWRKGLRKRCEILFGWKTHSAWN
jgi:hypothetical protein